MKGLLVLFALINTVLSQAEVIPNFYVSDEIKALFKDEEVETDAHLPEPTEYQKTERNMQLALKANYTIIEALEGNERLLIDISNEFGWT